MIEFGPDLANPAPRRADDLDTRVRMRLLGPEHHGHKLTLNLYLSSELGASDARVWCATCGRTLRAQGRVFRTGGEVEIGLG